MMEPIILGIDGQPARKSNSRRIVRNQRTGKPFSIKSQDALDWMEEALCQVPAEAKQGVGSPEQPLRLTLYVRYSSRRPDLSTELVMDLLQKAGVIRDDRYVFEKVEHKIIDKERQGVDILIEETQERNVTRKQVQVLLNDIAHVSHDLIELDGPYEDGSILTHWSDGEWYVILPDGETTGYEYDEEGIGITEEKVIEIRRLYDAGEQTLQKIGEMFNISPQHACKIGKRQAWEHVPEQEDE